MNEANKATLEDLRSGIHHSPLQPIEADDVAEFEAGWTDGKDVPSFAWLLRLRGGRYAAAAGRHDCMGWDCSLAISVHDTRDEAVRFGLTLNDRCNLGLLLPSESMAEVVP